MKFVDSIQKAYETKWSFINTFDVKFTIPNKLKEDSGWSDDIDGRDINLNIISIDTPQFTNSPIEIYIGNRWKTHNGRDELYRFTITFRDKDQMDLYRKFVLMYKSTREGYFDDVKLSINLSKDADWGNEDDKLLFTFDEVLIENVSQVQFSNTTENQIAEFSVGFKCNTPTIFNNKIGVETITRG